MKVRNFMAIAGVALALSSCSLLQPNKVKEEAVLPQDRESVAIKTDPALYTPEEVKRGVVKGDWAIESVNGKDAVGEKAPFIKFVPSEKRIYGSNGCNVINAAYQCNPADSTMRFGDIASTMMLCHKEGLTDVEINQALAQTRYYTWSVADSNYYLYFFDATNHEVMRLMHQNFQFLNGTWRVTRIGETPIDVAEMKMVIDVDEGKIHGNTGCNIYNGSMEIDMEQANSISFSGIAMTRMACPPGVTYETEFIVALEDVSAAKPVSPTEVILYDDAQKEVMRLQRALTR